MVATALLILNAFIFLVIAGFHFYWAFGGQFGAGAVLPEMPNKQKVFVPGRAATFVVALLFLSTSALFTGLGFGYLPGLFRGFLCVVAVVTLLRAIGDFRYVGFFQKRSQSLFSHNDLRYYSPLCLLISLFSVLPLWL